MLIQTKLSRTMLSLLIAAVIVTSLLANVKGARDKGARDGFAVQNVEISPKIARDGENVRVKANLRNLENKTKNCCVTAFVGESVVGELKEITLSPQETFPLLFNVNTSSLTPGNYPIDMVVEQPMSKQDIFDLGNIVVAQETAKETVEQEGFAFSSMFYLLPVFLVGTVVSFFVWKRERKKRKEQKVPEDLLPNLLNDVLNFEEKMETGAEKNSNSSDDKSYIR